MSILRTFRRIHGAAVVASGVASLARRTARKYPGCKVLLYHSVDDPGRFRDHIACLTRHYRIISATELLGLLTHGSSPGGECVCLTFDDGHATFFQHAYAVLKHYGACATVFVPTAAVENGDSLWFDKVEAVLASDRSGAVRSLLSERFGPGAAPGDAVFRMKNWHRDDIERFVSRMMKRAADCGDVPRARPLMTWEQMRLLKADGLVEIGSHSATHAILRNLSGSERREELVGSRKTLEERLGCQVVHFAYPNGLELDFDPETIANVRAAGYETGFTTLDGSCSIHTDRWQIPRIAVDASYSTAELRAKLTCPWPDRVRRRERALRAEEARAGARGREFANLSRATDARDLLQAAAMIVLLPAAWTVPVRLWGALSLAVGFTAACLRPGHTWTAARNIKATLGKRPAGMFPTLLTVRSLAGFVEERLQILREYSRRGWRPRIRLFGCEHIEAALERGRGVVLWVCPFTCSDLVTKMALHRAGFAVAHLSRPEHGFSRTRLGARFLNPIRTRIEDRYLAERIVVPPEGELRLARTLKRRLQDNRIVSIRSGSTAWGVAHVPFLNGRIPLATGPISLALATGAALLPVFSIRRSADTFETIVEPALNAAGEPAGQDYQQRHLECYAKLLESYVRRHPDLWHDWHTLIHAPAAAGASAKREAAGTV